MTTEVILPKLGFSMTEGLVTEWMSEDGAPVVAGAPLLSIEAEKSTLEIEAPASGTLRIRAVPGIAYPVGTVLAIIE